MECDPRTFLWDVCDSADMILGFIHGSTIEHYIGDAMMRAAVERHFEIIGEALNRLAKDSPEIAAKIPNLPSAIAFRNLLIHGYSRIDDAIVWRTAHNDLPVLRKNVADALMALGAP
jgi:uncharacterized protein with HEPN domain